MTESFIQFLRDSDQIAYDIIGENSRVSVDFVLLVYHPKSPAVMNWPDLKQRMSKVGHDLSFDFEQSAGAVLDMLNDLLCRHIYNYEYEHWITCQMALIDNQRVIREPLFLIIDEEKRLKATNTKSLLLDTNKKVIAEIRALEKTMFAEYEELRKRNTVVARKITVEEMVKREKQKSLE